MSYIQSIRSKITVAGDVADVHARWRSTSTGSTEVAWCGVYVHPQGPVPGYWYYPAGLEAEAVLTAAGVLR